MSPSVSLISLSGIPECAASLLEAAQTLGFVYIAREGSGIAQEKVERMFEISKKFFASPTEEKTRFHISPNNVGWSSMHTETLDPSQRRGDFKEAFNLGEFKGGKAQQPLPPVLQEHEPELSEFEGLCHALCLKLLRLFAMALEIDETEGGKDWFTSRHSLSDGPTGSILRLLYYPSLSAYPDFDLSLDNRAGAHSDFGSITLLFQRPSQPGLEILHPLSGSWHPVDVIPDAILINIADLLSYWTAGLLRSTVHRVTPSTGGSADRYSMAYFCHPAYPTPLTPIPSELIRSRGERGANDSVRTMTALEHLNGRLSSTYGWKKST